MSRYENGRTTRERLLARLIIDPQTGCLLWTGRRDQDGYGCIWANGHWHRIHRVMWEMLEGPIPDGLTLDHVKARGCVNRHCASIAHLEPVTSLVNTLRGRGVGMINAAKTHCDNGHEFDLLNTYWAPNGSRNCRACNRASQARRYALKKAKP